MELGIGLLGGCGGFRANAAVQGRGGGDGFQEGCSFGEKAKCILKASLEPVLHGCEHLKSCNRKKNTNRLLRCLDVKGTALF